MAADDDMSALSLLASGYKGGKRKKAKLAESDRKKVQVSLNAESATERCYFCGKDIPRAEYEKHIDLEIARKQKDTASEGILVVYCVFV